MDSSDPNNSISSGISIPNWMKQKIGDRYDLDDSTFSPPSQDDNFFYIRYPKTTSRPQSETNYHRINKYLESQQAASGEVQQAGASGAVGSFAASSSNQQVSTMAADSNLARSTLTGKPVSSHTHQPPALAIEFDPEEPPPNLRHRRGSKSLPSSPNTSPRLGRKNINPVAAPSSALQNRYFTAAFPQAKAENTSSYTGWLLSGILGSREQGAGKSELAPISESPGKSPGKLTVDMGLRKSASAVALHSKDEEEDEGAEKPPVVVTPIFKEQAKKVKVIKPKPSELREMNFWSPTSM